MLRFFTKLSTLDVFVVKPVFQNIILAQRQLINKRSTIALYSNKCKSNANALSSMVCDGKSNSLTSIQLTCKRFYAKRNMAGRKDSGKKGKDSPKVDLNEEDIIDIDKMRGQMDTTINYLKKDLTDQLALRLSLSTVASISVETEDGKLPLSQLGQVQQKTPQMIIVNMTENPQYTNAVKTAILNSGINVTPQVEGVTLYLPIQKVTREHREKLAKNAKAICDKCKEKLRHIQNNYDRDLKVEKAKQVHSQDLLVSIHEAILATTKEYNAKVDELLEAKQNDLLRN